MQIDSGTSRPSCVFVLPDAASLLTIGERPETISWPWIQFFILSIEGGLIGYSDEDAQNRAIITVLGSDRSGIVAAVTGVLSEHDANILDISQTILQGIFTMTMLVDLKDTDVSFKALQAELQDLSQKLDVQITLQREEVFRFMYRL